MKLKQDAEYIAKGYRFRQDTLHKGTKEIVGTSYARTREAFGTDASCKFFDTRIIAL